MDARQLAPQFQNALQELDAWLSKRGLRLTLNVVGACVLQFMGLDRQTEDIDSALSISNEMIVEEIAAIGESIGLGSRWLNDGASILPLPDGFESRLEEVPFTRCITLMVSSRIDLIRMKAGAYMDRGLYETKDLEDLGSLLPSRDEIEDAIMFVIETRHRERERFDEILTEIRSVAT